MPRPAPIPTPNYKYGADRWLGGIGGGAASGAAAGSVVGPWGTVIGGVAGAAVGAATTAEQEAAYKQQQEQQAALTKDLESTDLTDRMMQANGLQAQSALQSAKTDARTAAARAGLTPAAAAALEQQSVGQVQGNIQAALPNVYLAANQADLQRRQQVMSEYQGAQDLASAAAPSDLSQAWGATTGALAMYGAMNKDGGKVDASTPAAIGKRPENPEDVQRNAWYKQAFADPWATNPYGTAPDAPLVVGQTAEAQRGAQFDAAVANPWGVNPYGAAVPATPYSVTDRLGDVAPAPTEPPIPSGTSPLGSAPQIGAPSAPVAPFERAGPVVGGVGSHGKPAPATGPKAAPVGPTAPPAPGPAQVHSESGKGIADPSFNMLDYDAAGVPKSTQAVVTGVKSTDPVVKKASVEAAKAWLDEIPVGPVATSTGTWSAPPASPPAPANALQRDLQTFLPPTVGEGQADLRAYLGIGGHWDPSTGAPVVSQTSVVTPLVAPFPNGSGMPSSPTPPPATQTGSVGAAMIVQSRRGFQP